MEQLHSDIKVWATCVQRQKAYSKNQGKNMPILQYAQQNCHCSNSK